MARGARVAATLWMLGCTPRGDASGPEAVRSSFYLTTRDDVRIAVTVSLPRAVTAGTRLPTIVRQTRYWRAVALRWPASAIVDPFEPLGSTGALARAFLARGYAWVDVDVRGSGASFGTRPYEWTPAEVADGAEVVEWVIRQPWSNGRVGATGISYDGTAAELLLANRHPAVKAVAPLFSLFDIYNDILFPGGVPFEWFWTNWGAANRMMDANRVPVRTWQARLFAAGVERVDGDRGGRLLARAVTDHAANWDVARAAARITFRDDALRSGSGVTMDSVSPFSRTLDGVGSGVPVFSLTGWYDGAYARAAVARFRAHPDVAHTLVIGPWSHGWGVNVSGDPSTASRKAAIEALIDFFDQHLREDAPGTGPAPGRAGRVRYYTMGEDRWKSADTWPPRATPTPLYFAAGASLDTARPRAAAGRGGADDGVDVYQTRPDLGAGGVPRWGDLLGTGERPIPPNPDAGRLLYTSPPLAADIEVTGHPIAELELASSASDGTLFVYLEDVAPDGRVRVATEGMFRAVHRRVSAERPPYPQPGPYHSYLRRDAMPLVPGVVTAIAFDLLPTSYLFRAGHRIRVALAGADKDNFTVLPGPEPVLQVYRAGARASRLVLPVVSR